MATANEIVMGPFPDVAGFDEAKRLDHEDPLARFRERFVIPDPDLIYLDGNSLGRQPAATPRVIDEVVASQWADRLIRNWNEGWWELQLRLGDLMAPLVGAEDGEVIISDSTSVNLYKLAGAAIQARPGRRRIITDDLNFPTDIYVLDGIARAHGMELVIMESDGVNGPVGELMNAIDGDTALVALSHTTYMSGYTYEMGAVNERAHAVGALTLWDTSHSAGSVPIDFAGTGTDLAVGCTYKYLNGGPGSPAFLYVRRHLQTELENPISAWWSHESPFELRLDFAPVEGIRRFHTGTMPILSMAAIEPGIALLLEAGMDRIRAKSVRLGEYLIAQWRAHLESLGFGLASPTDPERRGSHVSLAHEDAWALTRAWIELGNVIPDFRQPDSIRIGLAPLYTSFTSVHTAVQRLAQIARGTGYEQFREERALVT